MEPKGLDLDMLYKNLEAVNTRADAVEYNVHHALSELKELKEKVVEIEKMIRMSFLIPSDV